MRNTIRIQVATGAVTIAMCVALLGAGEARAAKAQRFELHTRNANPLPRLLIDAGRMWTGAARRYWEDSTRFIEVMRAKRTV